MNYAENDKRYSIRKAYVNNEIEFRLYYDQEVIMIFDTYEEAEDYVIENNL